MAFLTYFALCCKEMQTDLQVLNILFVEANGVFFICSPVSYVTETLSRPDQRRPHVQIGNVCGVFPDDSQNGHIRENSETGKAEI